MHVAVTNCVDEDDAPVRPVRNDIAQHGHHRGDAHAGADQHDGRVGGEIEREVAVGMADLELGSLGEVLMQDVGDAAGGIALSGGGFLLDGDAEVGGVVGGVGETVLSGLVEA